MGSDGTTPGRSAHRIPLKRVSSVARPVRGSERADSGLRPWTSTHEPAAVCAPARSNVCLAVATKIAGGGNRDASRRHCVGLRETGTHCPSLGPNVRDDRPCARAVAPRFRAVVRVGRAARLLLGAVSEHEPVRRTVVRFAVTGESMGAAWISVSATEPR